MKERIEAVSRMFWATVIAALVVIPIGIPIGDNRATMAALEELEGFRSGFPREKLEDSLLAHAAQQGLVQPARAAAKAGGKGVPALTVSSGAKPIQPRAALELATLASVEALNQPGATLEIASPDAASIGTALGWRLARRGGSGYELVALELTRASAKPEEVAREQQAAKARLALIDANAALKQATAKHESATELWEARRKWKATWKAIGRANKKRLETREVMVKADAERDARRAAYDKLAKAAGAFEGHAPDGGDFGVVEAHLTQKPEGETLTLKLPVELKRRTVAVPHLENAGFPVAKDQGLWDAIKDGTPEQGIALLGERFSWHYAHVSVGSFKLGGMTLLQLAPLLPLLFLGQISRRTRGVGSTYNPFDRPNADDLPRVGLGNGVLNLLALVGLPLAGAVLCGWSLIQIGHLPVLPVLCVLAIVGIGGFAQSALGELMDLRDAIERSHSNPPPAPST